MAPGTLLPVTYANMYFLEESAFSMKQIDISSRTSFSAGTGGMTRVTKLMPVRRIFRFAELGTEEEHHALLPMVLVLGFDVAR